MALYKVLCDDGKPFHGGLGQWALPTRDSDKWIPGDWMPPVAGDLKPCKRGYHLCRDADLVLWLGPAIYLAEGAGDHIACEDKLVFRQARLLRPIETWSPWKAIRFAIDCAERVLGRFEARFPTDDRPRKAIEIARTILEERVRVLDPRRIAAFVAGAGSAVNAAGDAAADAHAAAYAAAAYAARAADAARAVNAAADAEDAEDAARAVGAARAAYAANAARAAAYAARAANAAHATAYAAADAANAARAAYAADAARAADAAADAEERAWQTKRLMQVLGEEE